MRLGRMHKKIRILSLLAFFVVVWMGTGCSSGDTGQVETPTPSGQVQTDTASTSIQVQSGTSQPPVQAGTPQPPGDPPPGKVWSPEHGHWHRAPGQAGTPQPPGDPPPGKVWSEAHGHWHNAQPGQAGADTVKTGAP